MDAEALAEAVDILIRFPPVAELDTERVLVPGVIVTFESPVINPAAGLPLPDPIRV